MVLKRMERLDEDVEKALLLSLYSIATAQAEFGHGESCIVQYTGLSAQAVPRVLL